jgi:hypothetical protein
VGSNNFYQTGLTTSTSTTVNGLPTNGETIYARILTNLNGAWVYSDSTYTAETLAKALLTYPSAGSTLSGTSVTFMWTAGSGATMYDLYLGTTGVGSNNFYQTGHTTSTSATVNRLPTNGETIYARILTYLNGAWEYSDSTYIAQ